MKGVSVLSSVLRSEYPRPDKVRKEWMSLNGTWGFAFDDENRGTKERWFQDLSKLNQQIVVPFPYQAKASGIGTSEYHPIVWYGRRFSVPANWDKRTILHFGAVDYEATVWVNGVYVGSHQGGYVPFSFDITDLLQPGENEVVLRVVDMARIDQPRGKQSARDKSWACWYTPVTGIWQSVWLEHLDRIHIKDFYLVPDIENQCLLIEYTLSEVVEGLSLEATVLCEGKQIVQQDVTVSPLYTRWSNITPMDVAKMSVPVPQARLWSVEDPFLYDLTLTLKRDGQIVDEIKTYFGMREVTRKHGQVYLNGRPCYQRLVLDQGYWAEGIYTPRSVEDLKKDVELIKALGFNGVRKHQKIEDPYFYYYCDKLGLLVWSEMPACYEYTETGAENLRREWTKAVLRDRNHPSIIAWVPMNESWGVDQLFRSVDSRIVAYLESLYYHTRSLDHTRLVVSNDGWQHGTTDLLTIHEYTQDAKDLKRRFQAFADNPNATTFSHNREILLDGFKLTDQPIIVSEFGGVKIEDGQSGWGYGNAAKDAEDMLNRVSQLVDALLSFSQIAGYCYTQLTDVEQEVNGLLTIDRQPKADLERLRQIFTRR